MLAMVWESERNHASNGLGVGKNVKTISSAIKYVLHHYIIVTCC